jgi:hypothetical protein
MPSRAKRWWRSWRARFGLAEVCGQQRKGHYRGPQFRDSYRVTCLPWSLGRDSLAALA